MKKELLFILVIILLTSCEVGRYEEFSGKAAFVSFETSNQTLPAVIDPSLRKIQFEVEPGVDIERIVAKFEVPEGCSVFIDGVPQISGVSQVDFSGPVDYEILDEQKRSSLWEAEAVILSRRIIIDASHDGGVWWFPQSEQTGFDTAKYHQGMVFANLLRSKGFRVQEIGRGVELTEKMFFGNYIVIRAGAFQKYTPGEIKVYDNLLKRGMNLVMFSEHMKLDPGDELGDHLGLVFKGTAYGKIRKMKDHLITKNISSIDYIAGSVLTSITDNSDIEILGWLGDNEYGDLNNNGMHDAGEPFAPPVMGVRKNGESRIFFIGDMNGLQLMPQPFINNLIEWAGQVPF